MSSKQAIELHIDGVFCVQVVGTLDVHKRMVVDV